MHQTLDVIQLQKVKFTFEDGVREQLGSAILPGCRHHRTHPQLLNVTSMFINVLMNRSTLNRRGVVTETCSLIEYDVMSSCIL